MFISYSVFTPKYLHVRVHSPNAEDGEEKDLAATRSPIHSAGYAFLGICYLRKCTGMGNELIKLRADVIARAAVSHS